MVTDASPWHMGGVLYENKKPLRWFATHLTPELLMKFGASTGDSGFNTLSNRAPTHSMQAVVGPYNKRVWCETMLGQCRRPPHFLQVSSGLEQPQRGSKRSGVGSGVEELPPDRALPHPRYHKCHLGCPQ